MAARWRADSAPVAVAGRSAASCRAALDSPKLVLRSPRRRESQFVRGRSPRCRCRVNSHWRRGGIRCCSPRRSLRTLWVGVGRTDVQLCGFCRRRAVGNGHWRRGNLCRPLDSRSCAGRCSTVCCGGPGRLKGRGGGLITVL